MASSVTGGVIYRGLQLPEWQGIYLFGEYCSGRVWGLRQNAKGQWIHQALFENAGLITSFGEDEAEEIYLVDRNGSVYQLAEK